MQASTKQKVYCIHCGTPIASSATECSVCQQPQPVPGAAPLPSASARYSHPQGVFSIEVPQPWQVLERNFLNVSYMQISRPDVRAQGIRGMIQQALAFGAADLQIWLLSLPPGANLDTVYQAYIQLQNQIAANMGNQGAGVLAQLFTRPYRQEFISFGEFSGVVCDIRHSFLGLAATIERRFMTLGDTPHGLMGAVLIHQSLEREFAQWEGSLWEIATSFRFGQAVVDSTSGAIVNHLPPLRVTEVDAALEWSWLVDLGQGNFKQAQIAAEGALKECQDADTLFARAIVHQLQGEYKEALSKFESAFDTTKDKGRQLIIAATAYWVERHQGDILPDGFSIYFTDTKNYWQKFIDGKGSRWQQQCEDLLQQVEAPYARLEGRFIYEVAALLPTIRANMSGQFSADARRNYLAERKGVFEEKGQVALKLGTQFIPEAIHIALTEIYAVAGQQDREQQKEVWQRLDQLLGFYESSGNKLGQAWCWLRCGDLLASPAPLGHPILFGYHLSDRITDTTIAADTQLFDRSELVKNPEKIREAYTKAQNPVKKLEKIREAYTKAQDLFAAANAPRGEAMALLRLAYLAVVEGKEAQTKAQATQNSKEAAEEHDKKVKKRYEYAKESYDKAKEQFINVGDSLNEVAAEAGSIWVGLHLGEPERALNEKVKSFAEKAHQHEAFAFGLSFGLAFAYAGREALATQGDVETALRAARLAHTVFDIFDARLLKMQTHGDRADALDLIQDVEASLNEREKVVGLLLNQLSNENEREKLVGLLLNQLSNEVDPSDSGNWDLHLLGMQQTLKIVNQANSQYDADRLKRVRYCADQFAKNVPALSAIEVEVLLTDDPMKFLQVVGMDGFSNYQQKFNQFVIHEIKRFIENEVSFFAPFSRGIKAMELRLIEDKHEFEELLSDGIQAFEAKHDADAKREFDRALQAIQNHPEVNLREAMVYAAWRDPDTDKKALAAIDRYLNQKMPQAINQLELMQSLLNPEQAKLDKLQWEIRVRWQLVGLLVTIKKWEDAKKQLQEIERLGGSPKDVEATSTQDDILNYSYYGLVEEGLGDYDRALDYLKKVKKAMEVRRSSLKQEKLRRAFGGQRPIVAIYADIARILSKQNKWAEAFEEAELARARVLVEALGGSQKGAEKWPEYRKQLALIERLTTELALAQRLEDTERGKELAKNLEQKLQKENAELDEIEAKLLQTDPHLRELYAPQADIRSVANRLPKGTLLLAYLFFDDHLLAWAVTRDGLIKPYCHSDNGKSFLARPFGARARLWAKQWNDGNADSDIGKELAEILIKPFEAQINAANHLVIVPFAELNMFPFAALPWGDKQDKRLGLKKSLSYLPAASLLQHFHPSDVTAKGALIVGNPVEMSYEDIQNNQKKLLIPLSGARGGAELVAKSYGVEALIGEQATKEAVLKALAGYPKIIHLFTHGYFQAGVPLASGVTLANGDNLTADEFMGLELKADVVILSACDTGQGQLQGSELNGLVRSILYAGARAVVVSLWEARDIPNAMLMNWLHQNLIAGQPLAQALSQAQEQLSNVTVQQALDFCEAAQACIGEQNEIDCADHAMLTKYRGDILAKGGDYAKAAEAYAEAMNSLNLIGRQDQANTMQSSYKHCRNQAKKTQNIFDSNKSMGYDSPRYWTPFEIIGDWK